MLYEFKVLAETPREAATVLRETADHLENGWIANNVVHIARWPEPGAVLTPALAPVEPVTRTLTDEDRALMERASIRDKDPPEPKPEPKAKPVKAAKGTATIVESPDGEPAAVMEESPFANAPPVPAASPDLTPEQQRERAIALLQESFGYKTGPALVRALQSKLQVKKFNEVPDTKCPALLAEAEKIMAQLKPVAVP